MCKSGESQLSSGFIVRVAHLTFVNRFLDFQRAFREVFCRLACASSTTGRVNACMVFAEAFCRCQLM